MRIGIPKETRAGEARVASTPEVVKRLAAKGFELAVESGAGAGAGYPDRDYAAAGARLTDRAGAYDADLVLRVRRPDDDDVTALRPGGMLIGLLESCGEDPLVAASWPRVSGCWPWSGCRAPPVPSPWTRSPPRPTSPATGR